MTNIDDFVKTIEINTPYIIRCNKMQYFLAAESAIWIEAKSFHQALLYVVAMYYTQKFA